MSPQSSAAWGQYSQTTPQMRLRAQAQRALCTARARPSCFPYVEEVSSREQGHAGFCVTTNASVCDREQS